MGRHSNRQVRPTTIGETSSFDSLIAAGVRDGKEWARQRVQKRIAAVLSVLVALSLCCGGGYYWWDTQGKAKRAHTEAEDACFQQVSRMTESYNKSLRLYAQVSSKFNELDESYDLDMLAALQGKKPKEYENLHCSTDLDGDKRKAMSLKRSYDELSKEYRKALAPVRK